MRKGLLLAVLAIPALLGAQTISTSKHNLSTSGTGTITAVNQTEICIFCHFPHSTGNSPFLWNHAMSTATYTFYTSSTMNAATPTALSGSSSYCMSCHDGTVAVGDVIRAGQLGEDPIQMNGVDPDGTLPDTIPANIGTSLTDDHPVSIQYEDGLFSSTNEDVDLRDRTTANTVVNGAITLYLENEKVECGSCHNPHDNTNAPFLEVSNTGSQLCLTCHLK